MANIILCGLRLAIFFTTLIFIDLAYSANTVKVHNGSTTYYELSRSSIRGGTVGGLPATHSYNTHVGRPISVTQLSKQGIEIPAIKTKVPFAARFGWNSTKVREAVKFGLKLGKTNLYTIAGTTALAYVIDKMGWFDDDGVLSYNITGDDIILPLENHIATGYGKYSDPVTACNNLVGYCKRSEGNCVPKLTNSLYTNHAQPNGICIGTKGDYKGQTMGFWYIDYNCPPPSVMGDFGCIQKDDGEPQPVTDAMIDAVDFDDYIPTDVDIPMMSPYLGNPDQTVITEQPKPIVLPTETTTTQNPDGSTTTTATDTTVNVTINTTNQGDMYITTTDTTTTTTYQDGTQTSKTIDTKTTDYKDSTPKADDNDDTKQAITVELPDIPTDCDLVPTLCDTQKKIIDQDKKFYDWMRQPFDNSNQPDLPTAKDRDYTRKYPINIGDGQCPTPMELQTILAGTVSVSFEPFCHFASILRYLVLTGASIFAAYILLGVVKRG